MDIATPLTYQQALDIIGGLSKPSKMPGLAFGFSASRCITGSKLRTVADSVCSDCYACKGMYQFPGVKLAHERRWEHLQMALIDPEFRQTYIHAISVALKNTSWFRWHDSGDVQSLEHLELIRDIVLATPWVRHWLPTREYRIVRAYLLKYGGFPDQLNVRLSAHMVNQTTVAPDGCTTSAVFDPHKPFSLAFHDAYTAGNACPARQQGNKCGDCRACWDRTVALVSYPKH
jgi:hypothetical protein